MSEASDDDRGGDQDEEGESGGRGGVVITGEPAASSDPAEGSFGHPAAGLHGEALFGLFRPDDLDGDDSSRTDTLALIGLIGKAVGQERPEPTRRPQQGNPTVAVVPGGRREGREEQTAVRIGERVALAADEAMGRIVAALALDAEAARARCLRVEDGTGWARFVSSALAVGQGQGMARRSNTPAFAKRRNQR